MSPTGNESATPRFGSSVSVSGDTVVVGAFTDKISSDSNAGSVYVFKRTDNAWTQTRRVAAEDHAANDLFGTAVAVSEDTLLIGVPTHDGAGADSGKIYFYGL